MITRLLLLVLSAAAQGLLTTCCTGSVGYSFKLGITQNDEGESFGIEKNDKDEWALKLTRKQMHDLQRTLPNLVQFGSVSPVINDLDILKLV